MLAGYLGREGSYEGFDVSAEAIEWCQRTITRHHPNFRFAQVDVRNAMYNPGGTIEPSTFEFPYGDEDFDLVFLFSVFTHMLPVDVERYLREIQRVLRPGGRSLMTFFLLNDSSKAGIQAGTSSRSFAAEGAGYRSDNRQIHERAVAYTEEWVRQALATVGLVLQEPIRFGTWSRRKKNPSQDVVLARKHEGVRRSAPGGSFSHPGEGPGSRGPGVWPPGKSAGG